MDPEICPDCGRTLILGLCIVCDIDEEDEWTVPVVVEDPDLDDPFDPKFDYLDDED